MNKGQHNIEPDGDLCENKSYLKSSITGRRGMGHNYFQPVAGGRNNKKSRKSPESNRDIERTLRRIRRSSGPLNLAGDPSLSVEREISRAAEGHLSQAKTTMAKIEAILFNLKKRYCNTDRVNKEVVNQCVWAYQLINKKVMDLWRDRHQRYNVVNLLCLSVVYSQRSIRLLRQVSLTENGLCSNHKHLTQHKEHLKLS